MSIPAAIRAAHYTDRVSNLTTEHRAPCVTCGHDKTLLVEWFTEPRPPGWFGSPSQRLIWRSRVVGISPHRCRTLHSSITVTARCTVTAHVEGERTERRHAQAPVAGVAEYLARRPQTWAEARAGQPVTAYRPAARFAVTGKGACYLVRAS